MAGSQPGDSGELHACSRAFVGELIRLEDELSGRLAARTAGDGDAADGANPHGQAERVQRRLTALLDSYAHKLRESGSGLYFAEADYALSALADELLLHAIDWPGAELWREHLLERARFGTEAAGDRLFERIDALRAQPDPTSSELAAVYLTVLAMGFQGRYRHADSTGAVSVSPPSPADAGFEADPLAQRRQQLFQIACLSDPALGDPQAPLVGQAPPLDAGRPGRLPGLRRWTAVLAAVIVGYLLIGQGIWSVTTQPVEAELLEWQRFADDAARASARDW
jgi:type VI secretion system protein ImpK